MTLEQFIERATAEVRKYISDEDYIKALRPNMEQYYNDCKELAPILGSDQLSPSGYAYGTSLLYPDLP